MGVRTYITDDPFRLVTRYMPWAAAVAWALAENPEDFASLPSLDADGRWTNKYAIRVGESNHGDLWIHNQDGAAWLLEVPWA